MGGMFKVKTTNSSLFYHFIEQKIIATNSVYEIPEICNRIRRINFRERKSNLLKIIDNVISANESNLKLVAHIFSDLSRFYGFDRACMVDLVLYSSGHKSSKSQISCKRVDSFQSELSRIRFLGELYILKLISNEALMRNLYCQLALSHWLDRDNNISTLKKELCIRNSRTRSIISLLESCGLYFTPHKARNK